jgi:hypothetical protein
MTVEPLAIWPCCFSFMSSGSMLAPIPTAALLVPANDSNAAPFR